LGDALRIEEPEDIEGALSVLGRHLGEYRGSGRWEVPLVEVCARFSAAERASLWERVDGRFVIPLVEVLLDTGDRAGVARLAEAYGEGPAAAVLTSATAMSQSTDSRVEVHADPRSLQGCRLIIDGRPVSAGAQVLLPGSHTLRCGDGVVEHVRAGRGSYRVEVADSRPRLHRVPPG